MTDAIIPEAPSWKGREAIASRFGRRLRELRLSRGYTQVELDSLAGPDRTFISEIENGHKEPTLHKLEEFADAFSMTVSELLDGV